jgi:hypothetical protein
MIFSRNMRKSASSAFAKGISKIGTVVPHEDPGEFGSPNDESGLWTFIFALSMSYVALQGVQKVLNIGKCEHEERKVRRRLFTRQDSIHMAIH